MGLIPLVISNYPFGIGTSHEDVPIVDLIALEAFFIGTYEHGVHTRGVQVLDAGRKVGFWDVPENASDALKRYLACPPQVEMFHDCEEEHSQVRAAGIEAWLVLLDPRDTTQSKQGQFSAAETDARDCTPAARA